MMHTEQTESDILEFAKRWARYGGGPPGEIRDRFRMSEPEFFRSVLQLIDGPGRGAYAESTRRRIRHVAQQRLWLRRAGQT